MYTGRLEGSTNCPTCTVWHNKFLDAILNEDLDDVLQINFIVLIKQVQGSFMYKSDYIGIRWLDTQIEYVK